jgi:hypothetical protein
VHSTAKIAQPGFQFEHLRTHDIVAVSEDTRDRELKRWSDPFLLCGEVDK